MSKEYQNTVKELNNMESVLNKVVEQARIVSETLEKVESGGEVGSLMLEIGKIMDKHASDMENI